ALVGATALIFSSTLLTLDEQEMTTVVPAVGVVITGTTALVTFRYYFRRYAFSKAFVENEVLPDEFVLEPFVLNFLCVFYDAAVKLKHVLESEMVHPCTGFLASDPARAIHQQIL